jgi:hypothetical protein
MSATMILAVGAAATFGSALIPAATALIASPINWARDARRNNIGAAYTDRRTVELVTQIHAGADYATQIDPDPGKLASAAYTAAAGIAYWAITTGRSSDMPLVNRLLAELRTILNREDMPVPPAATASLIVCATALQLLLHRLVEAYDGSLRVRASAAAGAAAEVVSVLPDGAVIDFNPLTEHDPEWLRRAQAEWVKVAQQAGVDGWIRAVRL